MGAEPRRPLTWVQPADLLAHELVTSAEEGKDLGTVVAEWNAAGGSTVAAHGGAGLPIAPPLLQQLARALLDRLDATPASAAAEQTDPSDLVDIEKQWPAAAGGGTEPTAKAPGETDSLDSAQTPAPSLLDRLHGAWLGRAAGCLLGKPVEKIPRAGIREILESQGRWPLQAWFTAEGLPSAVAERWPWNRRSAPNSLAENISGMPEDDDLNFPLVALSILEQHGHDFSTDDVAAEWLATLPAGRVFTAERAAYRNLLLGIEAPATARHHNPFREWIGAQIRADVHGWVHPGDPVAAARSAWRDAALSHTRAGIHGEMAVAAMCAVAVRTSRVADVLDAGLSVVPPRSRYAAAVRLGRDLGGSGTADDEAVDEIVAALGHLHWVHVLPNTALVAFALSRSDGDFERAICLTVMGGWDTDSNGATVGSLCGAMAGAKALPAQWIAPLQNRLSTTLPGLDGVGFDELAARTLALVPA